MDSNDMIQLFFEIDANNNGSISKRELSIYLNRRDTSAADVDHIMRMFDHSDDEITFNEYCEQFNENPRDHPYPRAHDRDIEVVNSKMKNFHAEWVVANIIRKVNGDYKDNKDIAANVKKTLDRQLEPLWQVVMIKGQYWAYYSHEPDSSIVLKHKNVVYILFKTPGN